MSNKKKIAKKVNQNRFHSLKKEFAYRLALFTIENRMLRQQIAIIQSQKLPQPNYPSGGWIPVVDDIVKKRKESHLLGFKLQYHENEKIDRSDEFRNEVNNFLSKTNLLNLIPGK